MKKYIFLLLLLFSFFVTAQVPQVPTHMELGNMKLRITPKGQDVIQKHVNEIYKNEKFLLKMVDKASLYFPIIEKILAEEGVPEEFKYLCIQESGFRADAVSVSNAVGYWQFKDFTAREVGIKVENEADERKHIIYATRGAAKYLKKNYFYLKNWVYTCQSYQMGLGGTRRSVDKSFFGVDKMTINQNSYWYVLKFLAHKVAYEDAMRKARSINMNLFAHVAPKGTRISEIADEYGIDTEELKKYNMWLNRNRIPDLRDEYLVMVPTPGNFKNNNVSSVETITIELEKSNPDEINRIASRQTINPSVRIILKINGKKAILANSSDSPVTLALRGSVTKDKLMTYNDMTPGEDIIPEMVYYLQPKSKKSNISRHITKEDETLWEISQRYGITQKSIIKKNGLGFGEEPKPGRVLWLKKKRPKDVEIEYVKIKKKEIAIQDQEVAPVATDTSNHTPVNEEDVVDSVNNDFSKVELQEEEPIQVKETADSTEVNQEVIESKENKIIVHTVTAGETLYSISKKYSCKVEELVEWNNLENLSLSIGQEIEIRQ